MKSTPVAPLNGTRTDICIFMRFIQAEWINRSECFFPSLSYNVSALTDTCHDFSLTAFWKTCSCFRANILLRAKFRVLCPLDIVQGCIENSSCSGSPRYLNIYGNVLWISRVLYETFFGHNVLGQNWPLKQIWKCIPSLNKSWTSAENELNSRYY